MPVIDIEALLAPVSEERPAGEDLEYDLAYSELERAAAWGEERQTGDSIIEATEPDWRSVRTRAIELFARTRDLRVAIPLAQALCAIDGVAGLADGVRLIRELVDRYWDTLYPKLDEEENNDPIFRINALAALADPERMVRVLRASLLVEARGIGRFTFRDLEVANGDIAPRAGSPAPSLDLLAGALRDAGSEYASGQFAACEQIVADLAAIVSMFRDRSSTGDTPDFDALRGRLKAALEFYRAGLPVEAGGGESGADGPAGEGGGGGGGTVAVGALRSREDVKRILDQVCDYMRRNEPGHPAPLLIERARRLLDMSFMEIIQDMAPGGLDEVAKLAGKPPESSGY